MRHLTAAISNSPDAFAHLNHITGIRDFEVTMTILRVAFANLFNLEMPALISLTGRAHGRAVLIRRLLPRTSA